MTSNRKRLVSELFRTGATVERLERRIAEAKAAYEAARIALHADLESEVSK